MQPKQGLAGACAEWRWIGISRPDTRCPEVPGWTVRPLFPQLAPVLYQTEDICAKRDSEKEIYCKERNSEKVPSPELIRELNRFCIYEIANSTTSRKQLQFPSNASGLVRVDRDCAAHSLVERYSETEKGWSPDSDSDFLAQAGKPEAPLKIENSRGVRLAFLDTQPTGGDVPEHQGSSPHGYTLARIARDLVCAGPERDARCAAQITTRLALPIIRFDPANPRRNLTDYQRGGYLGMQTDLVEAIRSEVDSWRSEKLQRHLILNLSLAWDGNLFGGLSVEQIAEMRAGTQAVYRALQYAASFDALILAAAGNKQREPCTNVGPLLPAAWESQPPRDESCRKDMNPLLYAVGGVKADGSPLGNARLGGMPRRAAYGETALFSGSSVATAIASAIAAVVWDSFPNLTSHEVMGILDETGASLPVKADFYFGAPTPLTFEGPVARRLLLCAALKEACGKKYGPPCPLEPQECQDRPPSELHTLRAAAEPGYCEPWTYPQPQDEPCPACIPTPPPSPGG
jgi:hypothetical protein